MSYGTPRLVQGLKAGADLSDVSNEGKAVKMGTNNFEVILADSATDNVIGVIHCGNTAGKFVEIAGVGGGVGAQIGATVAVGDELTINASGQFIPAASTNKVFAIAKEARSTAGSFIDVDLVGTYIKA